MIKYLLAFLLFYSPCLAGMGLGGFPYPGPGCKDSSGAVCPDTTFFEQKTYDNAFNIGSSSSLYRAGLINTSATPLSFCKIELYVQEFGALTGKTLYIERWTVNETTKDLVSKQEDVATYDPTLAGSSLGWVTIMFGKTIALAQNEAIIFTLNETIDTSNYFRVAYKASDVSSDKYADSYDSYGVNSSIIRDLTIKLY